MKTVEVGMRITLKNILFLTDFSEPSEAALPFAVEIARAYGAKTFALHVLRPDPLLYSTPASVGLATEAQEESAKAEMQRIGSHLAGMPHETMMEWGIGMWPTIARAIKENHIDLIVLGTHGRTGSQKLLLGSVAEEIFRRSRVPVLTIGPCEHHGAHKAAKFRRGLFPSDFTPESLAAAPYAISMAQENEARLILLHVTKEPETQPTDRAAEDAMSNLLFLLHAI